MPPLPYCLRWYLRTAIIILLSVLIISIILFVIGVSSFPVNIRFIIYSLAFSQGAAFAFLPFRYFVLAVPVHRICAEACERGGATCLRCGFDLRLLSELGTCPECGTRYELANNLAAWQRSEQWISGYRKKWPWSKVPTPRVGVEAVTGQARADLASAAPTRQSNATTSDHVAGAGTERPRPESPATPGQAPGSMPLDSRDKQ